MGILFGKFLKKKSTYEILEKLEEQITSIEEFGRSTAQYRKKIIQRFILLALFVYLVFISILYIYFDKISADQKIVYILPFIAFPIIAWLIKKFLGWYYSRKLRKNETKLVKLKEEKQKILDHVKDTETYKVAKKILEKFGNEKKPAALPESSLTVARTNQLGLRQRTAPQLTKARLSFGPQHTPGFDRAIIPSAPLTQEKPFGQIGVPESPALFRQNLAPGTPRGAPRTMATPQLTGTPLQLPRSILPSNRSIFDKMVDYLVGDGPSNRYALICKKCFFHNGMAFKEEVEYLSYKCCYCGHFNPARKKKPEGPKFGSSQNIKNSSMEDTSESDRDAVDSETDEKKIDELVKRRSSSESPILPLQSTEDTINSTPDPEKSSDSEKNLNLEGLSDGDFNIVESDKSQQNIQTLPEGEDAPMEVDHSRSEIVDNEES